MRNIAVTLLLLVSCPGIQASIFPQRAIAVSELQARADQALPRERSFLYAELVSRMTDVAALQFGGGDPAAAEDTLAQVRQNALKLQVSIADDSKRLRVAETMLQHASFRLEGILREAPYESRPALESTLTQVRSVEFKLMMQVFKN